jgi:ribosome-associated protein
MIQINDQIQISEDELNFTASKSSGPGGQYVNKVNSRVTLWFDLAASSALTDDQKSRIAGCLATRISKTGILRVSAQSHRSQTANKELAVERFIELIKDALSESPERKKTKIPAKARRRRLDEKKHRSAVKKLRSKPDV